MIFSIHGALPRARRLVPALKLAVPFCLALSPTACGGQTSAANSSDASPSDAHPIPADNDATPGPLESGAGPTGPNDATPVEPQPEAATGSDCIALCEAKATSCGAPSGATMTDCGAICAAMPTPAQLACIQSASCSSLSGTFKDAGTVCGIGQADGG